MEIKYEVDCYFPARQNCLVTLYQNAHVPPEMPQFEGLNSYPNDCWHDMYNSLMEAEQLICITGK